MIEKIFLGTVLLFVYPALSSIPTFRVFEKSGTFLVPAGVKQIAIEVWGAGGGGGSGTQKTRGLGGAGGGYGRGNFVVPSQRKIEFVVGVGGAGGADCTTGAEGGQTKVGTLIYATGGKGGPPGGSGHAWGLGGESNGEIKIQGQTGFEGLGSSVGLGHGGASPHGGFGAISMERDGEAPGGGGHGGSMTLEGCSRGTNGAPGRVIVYW